MRYALFALFSRRGAAAILANEGLTDAFEHISLRIPGTDKFLIPPFASLALVQESDLLTLNLDGKVVEGSKIPNREVREEIIQ